MKKYAASIKITPHPYLIVRESCRTGCKRTVPIEKDKKSQTQWRRYTRARLVKWPCYRRSTALANDLAGSSAFFQEKGASSDLAWGLSDLEMTSFFLLRWRLHLMTCLTTLVTWKWPGCIDVLAPPLPNLFRFEPARQDYHVPGTRWKSITNSSRYLRLPVPAQSWRHSCLLRAATSTSSQVSPIPRRSFLTMPLQFVFGRPGLLLKSGTSHQYSASIFSLVVHFFTRKSWRLFLVVDLKT